MIVKEVYNCYVIVPSTVALEMASDFNSTSQSGQGGDADGDTIRNAVVASVVGVGCVVTLCLLVIFAVLHCHFKKDKGQLSPSDVIGIFQIYTLLWKSSNLSHFRRILIG